MHYTQFCCHHPNGYSLPQLIDSSGLKQDSESSLLSGSCRSVIGISADAAMPAEKSERLRRQVGARSVPNCDLVSSALISTT